MTNHFFLLFSTPQIRNELETQMNCNLKEFKEFIDNETLLILGLWTASRHSDVPTPRRVQTETEGSGRWWVDVTLVLPASCPESLILCRSAQGICFPAIVLCSPSAHHSVGSHGSSRHRAGPLCPFSLLPKTCTPRR